ncbi:prepilin-type N-terminal cleavage/methylation domain-containing protein [Thiobacillus sp.]|uniref:prepilin-type N-terminal cleavage/methylation domain-containing protein n=1 Tax=Thiobacillus sp. TaxID=924 RepID=UPI00286E8BEE|nr:prepilin-type N-terminal cleavage/methylation domain-containing protein [Thiobacillus sp.]
MTHPQIKRRQSGFTLIEIAIVLVIIGLLLGGILKGQELITQGRIRNVANDFQSMTAAINLYQDRYRAIPGDDIGAATRWAVTGTSTTSGNGDGVIGIASSSTFPAFNSATAGDESRLFWHHLRLAGLVGGPTTTGALGTATPINAVSGATGVQNIAFGIPGLVICSSNLPAKIAQAIDTQFDDGNATTGTVRGAAAMSATAPTDDYVDDGTTFYIVCKAP